MILKHLTSLTLAAIVIQAVPAHGQSSAREDAVLTEVRLLRHAIETLAGTNARVQIVFGRLQLQDQRAATTARRLEEVRGALSKVVGQIAQMTESLQRYEDLDLATLEPRVREQIPMEIRSLKSEVQRLETERLRLATQEADAANQLAMDQNTWNDLNRSLDELERSLTKPIKQ